METLWSVRRPVRELRPGDHAWLAYGCQEERICVVGAFVRAGLDAGDTLIYLAGPARESEPLPPVGLVPDGRLTVYAPDPGSAGRGSDLTVPLAAMVAEVRRAVARRDRHVRVVADLSWVLSRPSGPDALAVFERELEPVVSGTGRVIALCQLDRHRCTPAQLTALHELHPISAVADPQFEDEVLRIERTFHPAGLAFAGELDASRHEVLVAALDAVSHATTDREIQLDLSGLGFIDLGALNILADTAGRVAPDRTLVLVRMPAQIRTIMDAVGRHMLPGLRIGGE